MKNHLTENTRPPAPLKGFGGLISSQAAGQTSGFHPQESRCTGDDMIVEKQNEIPARFQQLDVAVARLEKVVEEFARRLQPVLKLEHPEDARDRNFASTPSDSAMGSKLSELHARVINIQNSIDELDDMLAL
jgi:hypothetical protein